MGLGGSRNGLMLVVSALLFSSFFKALTIHGDGKEEKMNDVVSGSISSLESKLGFAIIGPNISVNEVVLITENLHLPRKQ